MTVSSNELLAVEKLPNGLTVVGQRMPGVQSVALCFHVRTGSRDENPDIAGVSHFLEHMMFKGTETRSASDISREFEEMGAEFNAFTWVESTVYYARVLGDQLPKALDILADMMKPKLDPEEFAMEKGVIIEEIARSEDQPLHELIHQLFSTFFGKHPLGNSVLGTTDTIRNMLVERMGEYQARRYNPNNIVMGVAGNFQWDALLPLVQEETSAWTGGQSAHTAHELDSEPRVKVDVKKNLQQEHVALASLGPAQDSDQTWAAELLSAILGDSSGSRLYWEITQKGLADVIETEYYGFDGAGMFLTYYSASPDQAKNVLSIIRREMERLQNEGVTQEELDRAKIKAVSDVVIGAEATHRRMFELVDLYIAKGRAMSIDEMEKAIESVTVDDINKLLRDFPLKRYTTQAAGPLSEQELVG